MKLQNEKYKIDILSVNTNSLNLEDYEYVYFKENVKDEFSKSHIITIHNGDIISRITLVGDLFLYDDYCAVLEDAKLTVLQNDMIVQIDLDNCRVIQQKLIEEFGGNFELHLTSVGYLVYGESLIATYDNNLNQIWSFSGKDIFVKVNDGTALVIGKDTIKLYDFEGNFYELDFNGKLITETSFNTTL